MRANKTASDSSGIRSSALATHSVSYAGVQHSRQRECNDYLNPSFLYPAASAYQLAKGFIHRFNQGRLMMKFVREGADILNGRLKLDRDNGPLTTCVSLGTG